jgi:uncharacterized RDD family membrane protein YckC
MQMDNSNVEYAGFWVRVAATLVDSVLIALIIFPLLYSIYGDGYLATERFVLGFWDFLLSYVLPAVGTVLFWAYKSATPGKMLIRARIVDARTGRKATTGQLMLRYVGYFAAMIPLMLGILWVAFDKRKQGWHDKIASTVVIRKRDLGPEPVSFED